MVFPVVNVSVTSEKKGLQVKLKGKKLYHLEASWICFQGI